MLKINDAIIGSLIEYAGVGVAIFTLILTNPELWQEQNKGRKLSKLFVFVPFPYFTGLVLLLIGCIDETPIILKMLGYLGIILGTVLLVVTHLIFLLCRIAPRYVGRSFLRTAEIFKKIGLNILD